MGKCLVPQRDGLRQKMRWFAAVVTAGIVSSAPAAAGPPYFSDDPVPTDTEHFEIYAFANGTVADAGSSGEAGIDFNYGALAPQWNHIPTRFFDGFRAGIAFVF